MNRALTVLAFSLLLWCVAAGQSGRKISKPKPGTSPSQPIIEPSPEPTATPKPPLPKYVDGERIYFGVEVDTKAVILKKPYAKHTREAERHRPFKGTVVLRAILSANGRITHITVVSPLPYGLTEKAIEAAQLVEFRPAIKDGQPVAEWAKLEYLFWYP